MGGHARRRVPLLFYLLCVPSSLPVYGKGGRSTEHPRGLNYMQFTESLWLGSGGNPRLQTATPSLHFSLPRPQDRGERL